MDIKGLGLHTQTDRHKHSVKEINTEEKKMEGTTQTQSNPSSNLVRAVEVQDLREHVKIMPFEQMATKHGFLAKVAGPQIQLPVMRVPWDCFRIDVNNSGAKTAQLTLSFENGNPEHEHLQQVLAQIDEMALEHIIAQKKVLEPKRDISETTIRDMYFPSVKESKDPMKYGPTMKTKLEVRPRPVGQLGGGGGEGGGVDSDDPNVTHHITLGTYMKDATPVPVERALAKGNKIITVIGIKHIWYINSRAGVTMFAHRMCVDEFPQTVRSFDFDL